MHRLDAAHHQASRSECAVDGCGRQIKARGWCGMHWARWYKHGDVGRAQPIVEYRRGPARTSDGRQRIYLSIEREQLRQLEDFARGEGITRAAAARWMLADGLDGFELV